MGTKQLSSTPDNMETERIVSSLLILILIVTLANCQSSGDGNIYSLSAEDASGRLVSFSAYRGEVLLVVNVASECGFTDGHYRELVKLHHTFSHTGFFRVIAFPCNQFGQQEPKEISDIVHFASSVYGVEFEIFKKVDVVGHYAVPLWKFLHDKTGRSPDWNFWKYLVDHHGNVIGSWGPQTSVSQIEPTVEWAVAVAQNEAKQNVANARLKHSRGMMGDL